MKKLLIIVIAMLVLMMTSCIKDVPLVGKNYVVTMVRIDDSPNKHLKYIVFMKSTSQGISYKFFTDELYKVGDTIQIK